MYIFAEDTAGNSSECVGVDLDLPVSPYCYMEIGEAKTCKDLFGQDDMAGYTEFYLPESGGEVIEIKDGVYRAIHPGKAILIYMSNKHGNMKSRIIIVRGDDTTQETPVLGSTTAVGQVSIVGVRAFAYDRSQLTWSKVENASGYEVSRSTSKYGSYQVVKNIVGGHVTTYIDRNMVTGRTYYYKVCAYRIVEGKIVRGSCSLAQGGKTVLSRPVLRASAGAKRAVLKWGKVNGASGYIIYSATSSKGRYRVIKTIKKGSTLSYTQRKLKKGKNYHFKIRAYRTVNGNKVMSADSDSRKVKIR